MFGLLSRSLRATWDSVESHIGRHPRTYGTVGFVVFFLPQWLPDAMDAARWLWRSVPMVPTWTTSIVSAWPESLSWWNLITAPVGGALLVLVFWRTRRRSDSDVQGLGGRRGRVERDQNLELYESCKRDFALARLRWFAKLMNLRNKNACVTVRFADYADFGLVQLIESLLKQQTDWPVKVDGTNSPTMRPDRRFKVIVESPLDSPFSEVGACFRDGDLIPGPIGFRDVDRADLEHLIIEVLPTTRSISQGTADVQEDVKANPDSRKAWRFLSRA